MGTPQPLRRELDEASRAINRVGVGLAIGADTLNVAFQLRVPYLEAFGIGGRMLWDRLGRRRVPVVVVRP